MTVASFAAAQLLRLVPRVQLSRAVGKLCEQELPPPVSQLVTRAYARAYGVNLSEAEASPAAYPSFDAFFTRRLKAGARTIEPAVIVSPSDGALISAGPVEDDRHIIVKGRPYEVGELIGADHDAERYRNGEFAVVYLHPRDYHRVHSPVDGRISEVRVVPGDLFPVNSIGERHVPKLFVRNRRAAIVIDTETLGRVTAVMVGATIVGKITVAALGDQSGEPGVHKLSPAQPVVRGDEIGTFHLGSTVVLLFEQAGRLSRATGAIQMGESLEKA